MTLNEMHNQNISELRIEVLKKAKVELRMNLSLLEMLKGNTELEDIANLRERWVEPLEELIRELEGRTSHFYRERRLGGGDYGNST